MPTPKRRSSGPAVRVSRLEFALVAGGALLLMAGSIWLLTRPTPASKQPSISLDASSLSGTNTTDSPHGAKSTPPVVSGTPEEQAARLVVRGNEAVEQGDFTEALKLFGQAAALHADDETIPYNQGFCAVRLGMFPEAERHYLRALEMFADYTDAHINLGNLQLRMNKLDDAMQHFYKALALAPENARVQNCMGTGLARQGRYAEAAARFQLALNLQTNNLEALFNLGMARLEQGQTNEARKHLQESLRQRPDFKPAQQALRQLGDP